MSMKRKYNLNDLISKYIKVCMPKMGERSIMQNFSG